MNTAEGALETATQLLDQVQSLGAQGASGTATAATQTGLSQQVENLLSQLVSVSQTQFNGSYVFSGDDDTQPAYQLNLANPNGVYATHYGARHAADSGRHRNHVCRFPYGHRDFRSPEPERYVGSGQCVPGRQQSASRACQQRSDRHQQCDDVAPGRVRLSFPATGLLRRRTGSGGQRHRRRSEISAAVSDLLGNLKNTDMATAAVDLTQEQTSMQAALQAEASMPRTSLFSYISGASSS